MQDMFNNRGSSGASKVVSVTRNLCGLLEEALGMVGEHVACDRNRPKIGSSS